MTKDFIRENFRGFSTKSAANKVAEKFPEYLDEFDEDQARMFYFMLRNHSGKEATPTVLAPLAWKHYALAIDKLKAAIKRKNLTNTIITLFEYLT